MEKNKWIVGIDPGFKGAIAFLSLNDKLYIRDLPLTLYNGKKQIDHKVFSAMISTRASVVSFAAIEVVGSRPGQDVGSVIRFGFNAGVLHGVFAAHGIKVLNVVPAVWKSCLGLDQDKKKSLELARKLFPDYAHYFKLAKHDGRAEAALIAYFARKGFSKL